MPVFVVHAGRLARLSRDPTGSRIGPGDRCRVPTQPALDRGLPVCPGPRAVYRAFSIGRYPHQPQL